MKKQITNRAFELRQWQQEAFRAVTEIYDQQKRDFLCVATPGSGKTKFALATAHKFLENKICDRVVVITPSDNLKRQWATEAALFAGIDLDPHFTNHQGVEAADFHGIVITYALLGMDKKNVHKQLTFNHKTFVIFDEVHHAGESLTWGDAIKNSFEDAVFRLSISGTAFRSDDNEIPFIKYENNYSKADYNYSYERSIKENVCRPVYFTITDGKMKWKVDRLEFEHSFKDHIDPDQVSKRLKTALSANGQYVRDVMKAANHKLNEIRVKHPQAGGLVFAATQRHAKEIANMVQEITGELPPVVISEDADGNQKIEQFKHDGSRWLVSVKMVSEGVDIPRLRIGVYFTITKAELFFRQAIGRFVRVQKELKEQEAYIFIPQDHDLVKLAETIQEEREHALDDCKQNQGGASNTDLFGNDYTPALQGKFVPLQSESTDSRTIAVAVEITSGAKHGVDYRKVEAQNNPVFVQKEILKKRLNDMAKRYALKARNGNREVRPDWKLLHKLWVERGGRNMEFETIDELKKREQFYINTLRA